MLRRFIYWAPLLLLAGAVTSEAGADKAAKELSGMSVVGDHESPKSLVIVPWKSSELGDALDVSQLLDDGRQPVDRDVFMRQMTYHELRAEANKASRIDRQ